MKTPIDMTATARILGKRAYMAAMYSKTQEMKCNPAKDELFMEIMKAEDAPIVQVFVAYLDAWRELENSDLIDRKVEITDSTNVLQFKPRV